MLEVTWNDGCNSECQHEAGQNYVSLVTFEKLQTEKRQHSDDERHGQAMYEAERRCRYSQSVHRDDGSGSLVLDSMAVSRNGNGLGAD